MDIKEIIEKEWNRFANIPRKHDEIKQFAEQCCLKVQQNNPLPHIPYQKCPVCEGSGGFSPVQQLGGTTTITPFRTLCHRCGGAGTIPMYIIKD